jgi:hypothetical protein
VLKEQRMGYLLRMFQVAVDGVILQSIEGAVDAC